MKFSPIRSLLLFGIVLAAALALPACTPAQGNAAASVVPSAVAAAECTFAPLLVGGTVQGAACVGADVALLTSILNAIAGVSSPPAMLSADIRYGTVTMPSGRTALVPLALVAQVQIALADSAGAKARR